MTVACEREKLEVLRELLSACPFPSRRHPYLDTILPALEAMELALDLLEQDPGAAAALARLRR